jgi:hypothetical protein
MAPFHYAAFSQPLAQGRSTLAPRGDTIRAWHFEYLPPNCHLAFNHFCYSVLLAIFKIPNAAMPAIICRHSLLIIFAALAPLVEMISQSG